MNIAQEPLTGPLPQKGYLQDALFAGDKVPPPCSAGPNRTDLPASEANNNANANPAALDPLRCEFSFSDGRQCRSQRASLCTHHGSKRERDLGAKGAPSRRNVYQQDELSPLKEGALGGLEALCGDLTTATNINRALAQVFLLMAQGRIAQKQAVAFGYLAQLLLQTVPGIRSEFVSAFGYQPWATKLKEGLERKAPPERPAEESDHATSVVILSESAPGGERRISPTPAPEREISPTSPHHEPEPPHSILGAPVRATFPDYEGLVSRSCDLLHGKYDATPEGRREANALVTELELMKPRASKPPKGVRASVIEHMKRWVVGRKEPASSAPAKASRRPVPTIIFDPPPPPPRIPPLQSSALAAPSSSGPPAVRLPETPEGVSQTFAEPPAPNKLPSPPPSPAAPVPGITLTRTGHTHDWYAPASWSNARTPNPFPSRKEKLARKLRGMTSYRWRHLQNLHQSKSFFD